MRGHAIVATMLVASVLPQALPKEASVDWAVKPSGRLAIIDFRKGAPSGPPEHFRFTPDQISSGSCCT